MKNVATLQGVSKRYGDQHALREVSIEIPRGSVFALLGENGAGKTTALSILLGLVEADAGEATVLGMNSQRDGVDVRRRVGYVPERPTLYEWMTVSEMGWFAAGFYDSGYLPRYGRAVEQFGLPPGRKIRALSKGMRAKVALSLAMANQPDLLILDEPTSGLDTLVRREFLESMVTLAEGGQTVLLSSHQIGEVERVADIVAILHQGELLVVEPLDEMKERTRELVVTFVDQTGRLPVIDGKLIAQSQRGRQWQLVVRDLAEETVTRLEEFPGVACVEVRRPSLEEIFVAYLRHDSSDAPGTAVREVAVS